MIETATAVTQSFHAKLKKSQLRAGDILFVRVGANRGDCCVVPERVGELNCANIVFARPREGNGFFGYYFQSQLGRSLLLSATTGAAQGVINTGSIADMPVPVPPLAVQRRVAGVLATYDKLMSNNRRRIRIVEEMARVLYREWFVHSRVAKETCSMGSLGDLCDLAKDRFDDMAHSELPLLDLSHIPSRSLAPEEAGKASELRTSRISFREGDILFGAIRPYLHKVVVAPYPGVTNVSVLVLRSKRAEFRSLLAIVASSVEAMRWADQHSSGTKMPVIGWGVFKTMAVPVPSVAVAGSFEEVARPMLDELCVLSMSNQNLRRTRDLVLAKVILGELEVDTQAEAFEKAVPA